MTGRSHCTPTGVSAAEAALGGGCKLQTLVIPLGSEKRP